MEPKSNIFFSTFQDATNGFTFGIAFPETPNTDFIGLLVGRGTGWSSVSLGGSMLNKLLLVAWPNGSKGIVGTFRKTAWVCFSFPPHDYFILLSCGHGISWQNEKDVKMYHRNATDREAQQIRLAPPRRPAPSPLPPSQPARTQTQRTGPTSSYALTVSQLTAQHSPRPTRLVCSAGVSVLRLRPRQRAVQAAWGSIQRKVCFRWIWRLRGRRWLRSRMLLLGELCFRDVK